MSITLLSNDGQPFQVSRDIIRQIGTLDELLKTKEMDTIPCPQADGNILKMIIEYCTHHINDPVPSEEDMKKDRRSIPLPQWDNDFLTTNKESLAELFEASHNLKVAKLTDACAQYIANSLSGKSAAEIVQIFGIECDLTPAEQDQIRKENAWCED